MSELLDQYKSLQEKIIQEEGKEEERILSSLATTFLEPESKKKDQNVADYRIEHEENMFALLCLKLKLYVQLSFPEQIKHKKTFAEDTDRLVIYAQKICCAYEISEELLNNVSDLLALVFGELHDKIPSLYTGKYKRINYTTEGISQDLYFLSLRTAKAYERMGWEEQSLLLLERLCELSRKRNRNYIHKELVARILGVIGDTDPETTLRIADRNNSCYEDVQDDYAGDFYWAYGCALQRTGMPQKAMKAFEKCYKARLTVSGEQDWFTVIAKWEMTVCLYHVSNRRQGRDVLLEFVYDIEAGKYADVDHDYLKIVEGKSLYFVLMDQSGVTDLNEYESLLNIYESICERYDNTEEPLIKLRLAANLLGGMFMKMGEYIQAEKAFIDAINYDVPDGIPEIVTVPQIKSNLLLIYYVQNDVRMAIPLLSELLSLLDSESQETGLSKKDEYRIYTILVSMETQGMMQSGEEELSDLKKVLDESCFDIVHVQSESSDCIRERSTFIICAVILIMQLGEADLAEQRMYFEALEKIRREKETYALDQYQQAVLIYTLALLAWNFNLLEAEEYFSEAIKLSDIAIMPSSTRIAISESYAAYSVEKERYETAADYVAKAISFMDGVWKSYIKYMDDERLMQILAPTQLQFSACYSIMRTYANTEALYSRVLQFKGLASLAGKERNRLLHGASMDKELLGEIKSVQDKIALLETEGLFRDNTVDYNNEKARLRRLEAIFASRFPKNNQFTEINYGNVRESIPNNSVVAEYYYGAIQYGTSRAKSEKNRIETGFDIFITQKKDEKCRTTKVTALNGEQILADAEEFVRILHAESNGSVTIEQLEKMEVLRAKLYNSLIDPIHTFLHGFENVYIAPDQELINLPFELIYDGLNERGGELAKAIKIESARDFLYYNSDESCSDESLIIGNPMYNADERYLGDAAPDGTDHRRSIDIDVQKIEQLPFSQVEVEHVGKRLGSRYYIEESASKKLLTESRIKYRTIHIATHGYFDLSNSTDKDMYSSCLLFSGVCNWAKSGTVSSTYGNGLITADEISRLDLRGTELVVLSSCLSGMNEITLNKGFLGMIGAFSAAGVHYVISHLWEAEDFSTAVLMDSFYYYYAECKKSPPEALALAKNYLRKVTIGDLKRARWFNAPKHSSPDSSIVQQLYCYERMDDKIRPFKKEAFWGGFTCYQCY